MTNNALLTGCLVFCSCVLAVLCGCEQPGSPPLSVNECPDPGLVSPEAVVYCYQQSLSGDASHLWAGVAGCLVARLEGCGTCMYPRGHAEPDLANLPRLVDEEVRTECRQLVEAYARYDRAGWRLAELLRAEHGAGMAQSFLDGPFRTFRRVALQSLFFVYTEHDDPVYAGPVAFVPRDGALMVTVEGKPTDYLVRRTHEGWRISRLSGNADWRVSMRTARKQLDALGDRFERVAARIGGEDGVSGAHLTSLLMLPDASVQRSAYR